MKPARGPKLCFFGNDCCGIIVVQIQMGAGRGSYLPYIIIRVSVCSYLFLLLCLLVDFGITTAPAAFRDRRSARNGCHGMLLEPCSGRQPRYLKKPTKIAFAHFAWHFIAGRPWANRNR